MRRALSAGLKEVSVAAVEGSVGVAVVMPGPVCVEGREEVVVWLCVVDDDNWWEWAECECAVLSGESGPGRGCSHCCKLEIRFA